MTIENNSNWSFEGINGKVKDCFDNLVQSEGLTSHNIMLEHLITHYELIA